MEESRQTSSRKKDHVDLVVGNDVSFHVKTTGLERYELIHNALPELDYADVDTSTEFLGKRCSMPLIISSMTGGYEQAEMINRSLAEVCEQLSIPMGVGSQRQAIGDKTFRDTYAVARRAAPSIALFGNIGGAEIAHGGNVDAMIGLVDLIQADGLAVHLNPLQELMQPEGTPNYRGVLDGIEQLVKHLPVPVIVKEVGAGLSPDVVRRLLDVGVQHIDVAGAGGTSWSGVELLRRNDTRGVDEFWDWGIPTADAIIGARQMCEGNGATLIGSGGIASARDVPIAIALGAHMVATARPMMKALLEHSQDELLRVLNMWMVHLRMTMFLTGCANIAALRTANVRTLSS